MKMLEEIQFQAVRLSGNRHFDAMVESKALQESVIDLMVSIVKFLNSALIYFGKDFFGSFFLSLITYLNSKFVRINRSKS